MNLMNTIKPNDQQHDISDTLLFVVNIIVMCVSQRLTYGVINNVHPRAISIEK